MDKIYVNNEKKKIEKLVEREMEIKKIMELKIRNKKKKNVEESKKG